jgi:hypothetical protein
MPGGVGALEEEEEEDERRRVFEKPLCAVVQNCTVLHNIVGPACIFLREAFIQSQLVCNLTEIHTHKPRTHAHRHACTHTLM